MGVSSLTANFHWLTYRRRSIVLLGAHSYRITLLGAHPWDSIDPSIRVTYHPAIHKASQTGGFAFFTDFNKTKSQSHIQRITIHNSKPVAISGVHIFDQVPVSEDERIKVLPVSPALVIPGSEEATLGGIKKIAQLVMVQKGVNAQWHGEHGDEDPVLGRDGRVKWVCELAPQEKLTLSLEYEVSAPAGITLVGI
jgi:Domain of unknown function (DUF4139)